MSAPQHDGPAATAWAPMTRRAWARAYLDMVVVDHGFIRWMYCNVHRVAPDLWRAAQPMPRHLRRAGEIGIRTVLNLRGAGGGAAFYRIERELCARRGLALVDFPMRSRAMPARETLLAARELFREIEYPVLMHCKSGADRSGFMSALFLHLHRGAPIDTALRQLSWRYGHVSTGRTGMLDYFFHRYREETGGDPGRFDDWVRRDYDPEACAESFRASGFANAVFDRVLGRE